MSSVPRAARAFKTKGAHRPPSLPCATEKGGTMGTIHGDSAREAERLSGQAAILRPCPHRRLRFPAGRAWPCWSTTPDLSGRRYRSAGSGPGASRRMGTEPRLRPWRSEYGPLDRGGFDHAIAVAYLPGGMSETWTPSRVVMVGGVCSIVAALGMALLENALRHAGPGHLRVPLQQVDGVCRRRWRIVVAVSTARWPPTSSRPFAVAVPTIESGRTFIGDFLAAARASVRDSAA
ncbi:hypothetical protein EDC29_101356 [Marichromatium gracile]|uniref:Uncharacterized protein n=1 Tax=Marichromatium gracile TaxID=1048 RepID=A0A4V2WAP2_MARGR|nr:hypothetical protein EDC29_101356 [Marichromatium gracile]